MGVSHMSTFTFDRAQREAAVIEAAEFDRVRVVQLSGITGGRAHRPDWLWCHGVAYAHKRGVGDCFKFWPGDLRDAMRAHYVINGTGLYVAGWEGSGDGTANRRDDGYVLLHPITEGQTLSPRRAYVFESTAI